MAASLDKSKPWLVMLYLAGDNTLTEEMVLAMQDLLAEGPPRDDRIVAQLDPWGGGLSAQRYDFTGAPKNGSRLQDYLVEELPGVNTGNASVLRDFIAWAVSRQKGDDLNYLLVLCGHGSGITENFLLSDDGSLDALTIRELSEALRQATGSEAPAKADEAQKPRSSSRMMSTFGAPVGGRSGSMGGYLVSGSLAS